MANMSTIDASPAMPNNGISNGNGNLDRSREPHGLAIPSRGPPPQSSSSDSGGEDDPLFVDPDDAQSMIQPALSPAVTRLTSPKTPAAEKAAAMDRLEGGGLFSMMEGDSTLDLNKAASKRPAVSDPSATPRDLAKAHNRHNRGFSLGQMPSQPTEIEKRPSPWQAGPRTHIVEGESSSSKPFRYAGFNQNPQRRSTTTGAEAFRRIRGAFPSITLPTNFFSNITSPSFLSGTSPKQQGSEKGALPSADGNAESRSVSPRDRSASNGPKSGQAADRMISDPMVKSPNGLDANSRPTSAVSNRPRPIRRSTSHDSMPYLTLSRVSSYGDDDRWGHVREQTNSRLKAIKDSWDRPTFKMPQLPNMIPAPLKRNSIFSLESTSPAPSPGDPSPGFHSSLDSKFPELDRAMESLTGDIVIMGGYRGSVLRSTKNNRQVWVPVKVGLNIRKVNLEVGLDPEDEEKMEETIYPSGMLTNIGPVDISKRLFKKLRECDNAKNGKLRVWDFGWDWRLSPKLLSRKLVEFLEKLPSNQAGVSEAKGATVIAHSLGGLITRHAVNQRPELFAGVIYAGTPQRCINILGPLRNGDAVMLNEKVLTAHVNFTLRTSFVFLPEDGFCFVNKHTGEEFPVDFYDPQSWAKYSLCPSIEPPLPAWNTRQSPFGSFLNLSASLPAIPGRNRGNSGASDPRGPQARNNNNNNSNNNNNNAAEAARNEATQDRTIAPQMGSGQPDARSIQQSADVGSKDRNMEYLIRTLRDTKQFRAELAHKPEFAETNSYPPFAVMYGKDIPTVFAAHVACREAIASTDCYDELMFRSGDGVVLAREAMLPPGYDIVKGGRISTDRGHITILGDLNAVGQALDAITRGRKKGIGLGPTAQGAKSISSLG
ncbi:hypothetical protein PG993_009745 [Apiospora rasikravindrae]|uniref:Uncharacterized protein n=1 Tax=Apiospora rasikravindrae TaxID=990691 RepID=A0ABR1SK99_9PEZI